MSWKDLWNNDLETFLTELEKQEAKEKADLQVQIKNASKKLVHETGKNRKKTNSALSTEVLPDPNAVRVIPKIEDFKEKYAAKRDANGEPTKKRGRKPKEDGSSNPKKETVKSSRMENFFEKLEDKDSLRSTSERTTDSDEVQRVAVPVKPRKVNKKDVRSAEDDFFAQTSKKTQSKRTKKIVSDSEVEEVSGDETENDDSEVICESPPPPRVMERRKRTEVHYDFGEENEEIEDVESDIDDLPKKRRKKIESDDDFDLSDE
ncbi:hypothetical protein AB6A40_006761 [Gnathostoma spinigerum]|uniref:Uncharacterized protein n=1 Tax=Gnathostoma spinigerum TaxID=75299 RepID=A0ABD6ELH6_9BILA